MDMRKLAVGAAAAAVLIVGGGAAIAAGQAPQTTADGPKQEEPSYRGSVQAPSGNAEQNETAEKAPGSENEAGGDGSESAEDQQLQNLAKIDRAQAEQAALKAVPGTVKEAELGNENGYVVWDVKVAADSGSVQEVKVDAGDGQVLAQEADDNEGAGQHENGGANEASEAPGE